MTHYRHLKIERSELVATVTLSRPAKRNALSSEVRGEIATCFSQLAVDAETKVAILTGGTEFFSAGYDLDEIASSRFGVFDEGIREYYRGLFEFPKPLITAVSGAALGGGFDLALAGDFILATPTALFGYPEIAFGVPPLQSLLCRRVGVSRASELAMTGRRIAAEEAVAIGIATQIVSINSLAKSAMELARDLAEKPLAALLAVKRASHAAPALPLSNAFDFEIENSVPALADPTNLARIEAYLADLRRRRKGRGASHE